MSQSDSHIGASQLPIRSEDTAVIFNIQTKLPRRQVTLIAITVLLNILLWSSIICFIASIYQIASDVDDTSGIPSEVLTLASSLTTISYILLHTIFSIKQRIWEHQQRHPSIKMTSYIAIRFAISLCILWLLTSGWNMITVARRPVCLPESPGLQGWEAGSTCHVSRMSITFAAFALAASCTLFWMLSVLRRPFEAHLLKHGYQPPSKPGLSPSTSRRPSPSRTASFTSENYRGRRMSSSTERSIPPYTSNTDVETIDLDSISLSSIIHTPTPTRTIGLGIFKSNAQPPPLPSTSISHSRASSRHVVSPCLVRPENFC